MLQKLKKRIKNQRGMTLVELLAVIVILGIISAIAVPSIGGLIDNTKKDAHVANAQQMVNAAKLAVAQESNLQATGTKYLTLKELVDGNYLDDFSSPDKDEYTNTVEGAIVDATNVSYVKINNGKIVGVKLVDTTRGLVKLVTAGTLSAGSIERTDVKLLADVNK